MRTSKITRAAAPVLFTVVIMTTLIGVPAPPVAAAYWPGMAGADSPFAAPIPQLGQPETGRWSAKRISRAKGSLCPHHRQMVEANATEPSVGEASPQRAVGALKQVDLGPTEQSGMDGGFQRLVSHAQRPADRTLDRARFVQSTLAEHPFAARSALGAGAAGFRSGGSALGHGAGAGGILQGAASHGN